MASVCLVGIFHQNWCPRSDLTHIPILVHRAELWLGCCSRHRDVLGVHARWRCSTSRREGDLDAHAGCRAVLSVPCDTLLYGITEEGSMTSPEPARWCPSRAGILNVYQYEDETLHFAGGRLLLRGWHVHPGLAGPRLNPHEVFPKGARRPGWPRFPGSRSSRSAHPVYGQRALEAAQHRASSRRLA